MKLCKAKIENSSKGIIIFYEDFSTPKRFWTKWRITMTNMISMIKVRKTRKTRGTIGVKSMINMISMRSMKNTKGPDDILECIIVFLSIYFIIYIKNHP